MTSFLLFKIFCEKNKNDVKSYFLIQVKTHQIVTFSLNLVVFFWILFFVYFRFIADNGNLFMSEGVLDEDFVFDDDWLDMFYALLDTAADIADSQQLKEPVKQEQEIVELENPPAEEKVDADLKHNIKTHEKAEASS